MALPENPPYNPSPRLDGSRIVRQDENDWKKYATAIGQNEADTIGFLPT